MNKIISCKVDVLLRNWVEDEHSRVEFIVGVEGEDLCRDVLGVVVGEFSEGE